MTKVHIPVNAWFLAPNVTDNFAPVMYLWHNNNADFMSQDTDKYMKYRFFILK